MEWGGWTVPLQCYNGDLTSLLLLWKQQGRKGEGIGRNILRRWVVAVGADDHQQRTDVTIWCSTLKVRPYNVSMASPQLWMSYVQLVEEVTCPADPATFLCYFGGRWRLETQTCHFLLTRIPLYFYIGKTFSSYNNLRSYGRPFFHVPF